MDQHEPIHLDPRLGELAPRVRLRIGLTAVFLVVAVVVGWYLTYSGVVVPRVTANQHGWDGSLRIGSPAYFPKPDTKRISTALLLLNEGSVTINVIGVDVAIPGLRFDGISQHGPYLTPDGITRIGDSPAALPKPLEPGNMEFHWTLNFEVTDCAAVPAQPQPIGVRLARPWGQQTIEVQLPPLRPQHGGWAVTTRDDPHRIEWQRLLADDVCGTRWEISDGKLVHWPT
jgi:hypothetical protein